MRGLCDNGGLTLRACSGVVSEVSAERMDKALVWCPEAQCCAVKSG